MNVKTKQRVLFLTPFNFNDERFDDEFDALVQKQFESLPGVEVVADHVNRFDADDDSYESVQEQIVVDAVKNADADGFDSVVIACYYDPAVPAARSAAPVPVIGPLQLVAGMATQYGPKFHLITDIDEAVEPTEQLLTSYGFSNASTGVTALGIDGDTILSDTRAAAERADRIIQEVAEAGEAQSVIIGCTIVSAAYEKHRDEFPDHGVLVLNSNKLALEGAAILSR
ncbi:aspartate/glutamate racemase family protein [Leucobacter denitrificans]|uniref:Aspartate/glutamate racemase family protein n=1 Tax=Leucobacter denitrificans TaxID=683042 RepID=A0A7G9S2A1_9MICO|nr:aspartate/glutamate racemase family protein [Leucobacter denitrificans]QNN61976.1 aspartate/glutamate racemase family protein [Leucobacter denitrificans]